MTFEKLPEPAVPPPHPRLRRLPAVALLALLAAGLIAAWRWSGALPAGPHRRVVGWPDLTDEDLEARIAGAWQEGRRLRAGGQGENAAAAFGRAQAVQRQLNARFPASRFVSLARLGEFEADRQTALAAGPLARLRELERQLDAHLRRRELHQAQARLAEVADRLGELRGNFPHARAGWDDLAVKIAFLQTRAGELELIQDRCYAQLVPLPGRAQPALMRAAVTQEDFQRVMGLNPSREHGALRRVDSVSQPEAEDFCRRLAWALGHPVRLPGAEELRAALAASRAVPPGEGGEEWLRGGEAGEAAAPLFVPGKEAAEPAARGARSSSRGFRVVVETDLAASAR